MKIGHISLSYRPLLGGQDTYIENLKKVFELQGHTNTVYQALSLRHKIDSTGVVTSLMPPLVGRFIPLFNWYFFNFSLRRKRKLLANEDALVVHYAFHYPAVKFHPKTVILSHGIEWHEPPRVEDDRVRGARARETFKHCAVVANDTEYLRYCGVAIEPGQRFFEEVQDGKFFIPNCVDIATFKKVEADPELAAIDPILVPRNIYFDRGVHLAVEAYILLVKSGVSKHHLVVVGKVVDAAYHEGILKTIEASGLREQIHFIGHVPWHEMPRMYSSAACTLIPTIDCEGTSLSALESMACGTPVVATNVGGLKDLPCVHTGVDALEMKNALAKVLAARESYSREQCESVRKTFNLENWSRAWKAVIGKLAP